MRAMQAAGSPWEQGLSGSVLSQLLLSVSADSNLADEVLGHRDFCRRVLELAAEAPLVIAVDDLDDADAESMRCLLYLSRRLAAARVLLLATTRQDAEWSSPYAAALLGEPGVHQLTVEPLSEPGTAEFVGTRLGRPAAERGVAAEMYRISGGNLRLLDALAEDYRSRDRATRDFVTEQRYGGAVVGLLASWGQDAMRMAHALAVLGDRGSPERVAQLAALDHETGAEAVVRAAVRWERAGLLRDGKLPHSAARRAILHTMSTGERAALHQRAAQLLYRVGEPASIVARHLAKSGQRLEQWGVPVLTEGAEHELLAGRNRRAARYLELARESSRDESERAAILLRLVNAEWQRNPLQAAGYLTPLVVAAQADHLPPSELPDLLQRLLWLGRREDAAAVLAKLRHAAADDRALATETRNLDAWLMLNHPQLAHHGTQPGASLGQSGRQLPPPRVTGLSGDPWLALTASLCELYTSGQTGGHVGWLEQSLRNLRPGANSAWAWETGALALLELLDLGLTDAVLARSSELCTDPDSEETQTWQAQLAALRAEALLRQGHLNASLEESRAALTRLPLQAWGMAAGLPLGTLITAATRSGDLEEAERGLLHPPAKALLESRSGVYYLHARGHYHLATQRAYAGLADFLACGDLVQSLGLDAAEPVPWRASAAEAWLKLGNGDRSQRLVRSQLASSDAPSSSGRGQALRMLAALSSPGRRPQLLLDAVEIFEELGDPYQQAQALADLGYAHSALGDDRRARTTLRRARYLARFCGATPLCEELLAFGESPAGTSAAAADEPHQLSESEQRVAHLAVLGYTNREIAGKLYITSSTVEQHLTRVYRKLDVKRRKDLPAGLGAITPVQRPDQSQRRAARCSAS
jgi:DNA-binding CsgD family transcriptional regulator